MADTQFLIFNLYVVFIIFSTYLKKVCYVDAVYSTIVLSGTSRQYSNQCLHQIEHKSCVVLLLTYRLPDFPDLFLSSGTSLSSFCKGSDSATTLYPNWHSRRLNCLYYKRGVCLLSGCRLGNKVSSRITISCKYLQFSWSQHQAKPFITKKHCLLKSHNVSQSITFVFLPL